MPLWPCHFCTPSPVLLLYPCPPFAPGQGRLSGRDRKAAASERHLPCIVVFRSRRDRCLRAELMAPPHLHGCGSTPGERSSRATSCRRQGLPVPSSIFSRWNSTGITMDSFGAAVHFTDGSISSRSSGPPAPFGKERTPHAFSFFQSPSRSCAGRCATLRKPRSMMEPPAQLGIRVIFRAKL